MLLYGEIGSSSNNALGYSWKAQVSGRFGDFSLLRVQTGPDATHPPVNESWVFSGVKEAESRASHPTSSYTKFSGTTILMSTNACAFANL